MVSVRRARMRAAFLRDRIITGLGLGRRGFFVPYSYAADVDRGVKSYPALVERLALQRSDYARWLGLVEGNLGDLRRIGDDPEDPTWDEVMFSPRDGAIAYTVVREMKPRRILEIGSGTSTRYMARAVADGGLETTITCIDPQPRRSLEGLGVEHVNRVLRREDESLAAELAPGDILFIDSSHVMLPGMDVDIQFNLMFPRLRSGVVVHVHDIFLPYNYPGTWRAREYNEQNALFGWIYSDYLKVLVPNHYISRDHADLWRRSASDLPVLARQNAGSMWLIRS